MGYFLNLYKNGALVKTAPLTFTEFIPSIFNNVVVQVSPDSRSGTEGVSFADQLCRKALLFNSDEEESVEYRSNFTQFIDREKDVTATGGTIKKVALVPYAYNWETSYLEEAGANVGRIVVNDLVMHPIYYNAKRKTIVFVRIPTNNYGEAAICEVSYDRFKCGLNGLNYNDFNALVADTFKITRNFDVSGMMHKYDEDSDSREELFKENDPTNVNTMFYYQGLATDQFTGTSIAQNETDFYMIEYFPYFNAYVSINGNTTDTTEFDYNRTTNEWTNFIGNANFDMVFHIVKINKESLSMQRKTLKINGLNTSINLPSKFTGYSLTLQSDKTRASLDLKEETFDNVRGALIDKDALMAITAADNGYIYVKTATYALTDTSYRRYKISISEMFEEDATEATAISMTQSEYDEINHTIREGQLERGCIVQNLFSTSGQVATGPCINMINGKVNERGFSLHSISGWANFDDVQVNAGDTIKIELIEQI